MNAGLRCRLPAGPDNMPSGRSDGTERPSSSIRAAGASFWMTASSPPKFARVPRSIRAVGSVRPNWRCVDACFRGPPNDFGTRASFLSVVVCGSQTGPAAARPVAAAAGWTDASHSIKMLQGTISVRTNDDKGRMKSGTVEWEPHHYPTARLSTQPAPRFHI